MSSNSGGVPRRPLLHLKDVVRGDVSSWRRRNGSPSQTGHPGDERRLAVLVLAVPVEVLELRAKTGADAELGEVGRAAACGSLRTDIRLLLLCRHGEPGKHKRIGMNDPHLKSNMIVQWVDPDPADRMSRE